MCRQGLHCCHMSQNGCLREQQTQQRQRHTQMRFFLPAWKSESDICSGGARGGGGGAFSSSAVSCVVASSSAKAAQAKAPSPATPAAPSPAAKPAPFMRIVVCVFCVVVARDRVCIAGTTMAAHRREHESACLLRAHARTRPLPRPPPEGRNTRENMVWLCALLLLNSNGGELFWARVSREPGKYCRHGLSNGNERRHLWKPRGATRRTVAQLCAQQQRLTTQVILTAFEGRKTLTMVQFYDPSGVCAALHPCVAGKSLFGCTLWPRSMAQYV